MAVFCILSSNIAQETLAFGATAGSDYSNVYDSEGEQFKAGPKLGFAARSLHIDSVGQIFRHSARSIIFHKVGGSGVAHDFGQLVQSFR